MKTKLLFAFTLVMMIFVMIMPSSYAAGANIRTNKSEVKGGETFELYVDLSVESIAYDIRFSANDSSLIKSNSIKSQLEGGKGNTNRVYLVQLASSEDRVKYPSGTRAVVLQYTVEDVTEEKELKIHVTGDIAGSNSGEKYTLDEEVVVNIKVNNEEPDNPGNPDNPQEPDNPQDPDNPGEPDNPQQPDNPQDPSNPSDPENPSNPSDPEQGDKPTEQDKPGNTDKPGDTDKPSDTDKPKDTNKPDESKKEDSAKDEKKNVKTIQANLDKEDGSGKKTISANPSDSTTANKIIPKTGDPYVVLVMVIGIILAQVGIVLFINNKLFSNSK